MWENTKEVILKLGFEGHERFSPTKTEGKKKNAKQKNWHKQKHTYKKIQW